MSYIYIENFVLRIGFDFFCGVRDKLATENGTNAVTNAALSSKQKV